MPVQRMARLAPYVRRPAVPTPHLGKAIVGQLTFPASPLTVKVELALGADLSANPGTWVYTDITGYVRVASGISITMGRADEASQTNPTRIELTVNNADGRFARTNPLGAWYGQLVIGTPIRISADPGTGPTVRGTGYIASLPPRWDPSGNDHWVPIEAGGVQRRLGQGNTPSQSAMTRVTLAQSEVAEFWPCEDAAGSTSLASANGGTPLTATGPVVAAADGSLVGSGPLPTFAATATAVGPVRSYASTGGWGALCVVKVASSPAVVTPLIDWRTTGTVNLWRLEIDPTTSPDKLVLRGYANGVQVTTASVDWVGEDLTTELYGTSVLLALVCTQQGADIGYTAHILNTGGYVITGTATTQTLGIISSVCLSPNAIADGVTIGQVVVLSSSTLTLAIPNAMGGNDGQLPYYRMLALCDGANIPLFVPSRTADMDDFTPDAMGPQLSGSLLSLLREAEAASDGALAEVGHGLMFRWRQSWYNAPVFMTLDYSAGHIFDLQPVDDDQRLRNDLTVARVGGSSARATAPAATLQAQSFYDAGESISQQADSQLPDQANWRLHIANSGDLRHPRLGLNLLATPSLIGAWTASVTGNLNQATATAVLGSSLQTAWVPGALGARITIANPPPDLPPDPIDLLIEGYTETLGPFQWDVAATCSSFRPYEVFKVEDTRLGRLDAGTNSTLAVGYSSSATTLSVATAASGRIWITTAARPQDFPFDIEIAGERITVTAIAGAASPQDFTVTRGVNGVSKAQSAGGVVSLWRAGVLAL